jgi:hypothetical protein
VLEDARSSTRSSSPPPNAEAAHDERIQCAAWGALRRCGQNERSRAMKCVSFPAGMKPALGICKTGFRVPSATICATAATFPWFPRNSRGTQ